ncbi:MAG TPA: hypothetical protein VIQ51_09030, partial [Chryseosolibacter sp.]
MNKILLSVFLLVIFSSCIVSKKKYDDVLAQKVRMEADLADRNKSLDLAHGDLADANQKMQQLREDTT